VIKELARMLLELLSSEPGATENKEHFRKLLAQLRQRYPETFSEASSDALNKRDEDGRAQIEQLILSLSVVGAVVLFADCLFMPLSRRAWVIRHPREREAKLQTL